MQGSFDTLSSFDKINLGSTFFQAVVAVSFAAVQHGVSRHFDRPAMRALAKLWYLLAIAAVINIFSSWSGAVWNDRDLSRALNSVVVALLAAGIPYVRLATDALASSDPPTPRVTRLALMWGGVAFVLHAAGVFGFGAAFPEVRLLAVTWSRALKLVVLCVPTYIAWRAYATANQHQRALRLLALGFTALAARQVISVGLGLRVGMADLPFAAVVAAIILEVMAIMVFGVMSLLANTAEELMVMQRQSEALVQAKARIASGERMESLGRLAAGVAHDFNNMLHVIRLAVAAVRTGIANEDDRQVLDEVTTSTQHGAALVSQLLTFARQQPQHPQRFDAMDRLRALTPVLQRIVGPNVDCTITVATDSAAVMMDPAEFEQIAINLGTNARDAVTNGGRVAIDLAIVTVRDGVSSAANVAPGEYVRLTVEDTGHGIPPEIRCRIFEPFFTTKESGRGSGLGLAMVHGITRRVGGNITVESTPGVGTRFDVYVPRVETTCPSVPIAQPLDRTPTQSLPIGSLNRGRSAIPSGAAPGA